MKTGRKAGFFVGNGKMGADFLEDLCYTDSQISLVCRGNL